MKPQQRICIYTKDVMRITGKSERYARKLINKIKTQFSKTDDQFISVDEFCQFTGLKIEQVQSLIID